MFAMAEVRSRTPKFNDLLQRCAERHPMYPEYNDELCPAIMDTYNGTETPAQLGVSMEMLAPKMFGIPQVVELTDLTSIDEIAEACYRYERQERLALLRRDIAEWGFSASELYPETVQSPSIH